MSTVGQAPTHPGLQNLSLYIVSEEKREQSLVAKGEVTAYLRPTDVTGGKKKNAPRGSTQGMSFKFKTNKQKKAVELQDGLRVQINK